MKTAIDPIDGACHCGGVRFTARLTDGLRSARRCTCSYCRMRGAIAVSADLDGINITQGSESLTVYQFNTNTAKHYFCSRCGIYTHHQRRSNPSNTVSMSHASGDEPVRFSRSVGLRRYPPYRRWISSDKSWHLNF